MIQEQIPILVPYRPEMLEELKRGASKEGHGVCYPTDVIMKGGELVGWFSLGVVPFIWSWQSNEKLKVRDSIQLISTVEGVMRRMGAPAITFPVSTKTPFRPYMERFGYSNAGNYDVFIKEF